MWSAFRIKPFKRMHYLTPYLKVVWVRFRNPYRWYIPSSTFTFEEEAMSLMIPGGSQDPNPAEKPQLGSHGSSARTIGRWRRLLDSPSNFLVPSEVYAMEEDQEKQQPICWRIIIRKRRRRRRKRIWNLWCLFEGQGSTFNCHCIPNARDVTVGNGFEFWISL